MKLSLGINLQVGPWGGGNQFGRALVNYMRSKKIDVSFDLEDIKLDLVMLTEPRAHLKSSAYTDEDIRQYLLRKNRKAIVVHRINECDERKGTTDVNRTLKNANTCADHTIFVSSWLKNLHFSQGLDCKYYSIILNGSDESIFHPRGYQRWDKNGSMRLVTHHWGGNWMKGFDIYERLDKLLQTEYFKHKVSFTYIGNVPKGFQFKNSTYLEPKHGAQLASLIRQHHVYITASQNEPGANHQNEGANCGLPLLYRESGCLPEYCNGFGVSFTEDNFKEKLGEMAATYDYWADRMKNYPHKAERMCEKYYNLFMKLLEQRDDILRNRG